MDKTTSGICASCGFLSRLAGIPDKDTGYIGGDTPEYIEAPQNVREAGAFYKVRRGGMGHMADCSPACFLDVAPLSDEVENEEREVSEKGAATRRVLNKPRACPKWYKYRPGLSPKEHMEERRMIDLVKSNRRFEIRMEKARRDWEQRREGDYMRAQRKTRIVEIVLIIVGLGLATAEVVTALWPRVVPVRLVQPPEIERDVADPMSGD